MGLLVTPTLLNSLAFALSAPPSWKAKAEHDFVALLRREKSVFPAWVRKGVEFEDAVYDHIRGRSCADSPIDHNDPFFKQVVDECNGGRFQKVEKRNIIVDGQAYLLYSKMDVVHASCIVDIKTTLKWKGPNKYLAGWQPKVYCHCANKPKFKFVVVEWCDEATYRIKDVHVADFEIASVDYNENEIAQGIRVLIDYLHTKGLHLDYVNTFSNHR